MIIAEVNLNTKKRLLFALQAIRGVGLSRAKAICAELNLDTNLLLGDLDEIQLRTLSDFIIKKYGEVIGSNLRRADQEKIQALISLGSYRGLRHRKKMPVRGQRTSSNAKTRRGKASSSATASKSQKKVSK